VKKQFKKQQSKDAKPTNLSCLEANECSSYAREPYSIHNLLLDSSSSRARLKQRRIGPACLKTGHSGFSSCYGKNVLCLLTKFSLY